ncbi:MAG: nucleotidyl transferase AbiEii/AbiGii toxin family protein [Bacteroidetes bacterium]|nr:nucleotidyl transferase AbiEii/AbiGii toxin family protein [Bacteroidota bacterium]MBU2584855.1 nucleotidyl transferase AbiEii/AbiGii toxin family protein [Bacteroidota bacterium]
MINTECFNKEWIDSIRKDFPLVDPIILEKTIYAFQLLSLLVEEGIEFVFKGGTSLLLLLPEPKRLSIDIDILTSLQKNDLETKLNSIAKNPSFTELVEDPRSESKVPKKHYKLFFNSVINTKMKSYVLLDVLFQENPYPTLSAKILQNRFITTSSKTEIVIPSVNSILGDKLTAFAANTTGIPFGEGKEMQSVKQLFDIGELFNYASDIKEVETSFKRFVEIESSYRENIFTPDQVKKDLYDIPFLISQIKIKGGKENDTTNKLIAGMQQMRSHLISGVFNLEQLKISAAKTACIVSTFGKDISLENITRYDISKILDTKLTGDLMLLERLKTILPEAYYYWQLIQSDFK